MIKPCNTQKSENKRILLEEKLLDMMEQRDFTKITVKDLCEEINIPRKSFYRYFSTKDEMLCSLVMRYVAQIDYYNIICSKTEDASILEELKRYLQYWKENNRFLSILEKNNLLSYLVECTARYIVLGEQKMPYISWKEPLNHSNQKVIFIVSGTMNLIFFWRKNNYLTSIDEMAEVLNELLTIGSLKKI